MSEDKKPAKERGKPESPVLWKGRITGDKKDEKLKKIKERFYGLAGVSEDVLPFLFHDYTDWCFDRRTENSLLSDHVTWEQIYVFLGDEERMAKWLVPRKDENNGIITMVNMGWISFGKTCFSRTEEGYRLIISRAEIPKIWLKLSVSIREKDGTKDLVSVEMEYPPEEWSSLFSLVYLSRYAEGLLRDFKNKSMRPW